MGTAATIELPLTLRTSLLKRALLRHLDQKEGQPVVFYQEGPYRFLNSERIQLFIKDGIPHFTCHGRAGLGFKFLGVLPVAVRWSGSIDLTLAPYVDSQWHLRYRILDSTIFDDEGKKPVITGFVWDLVKKFLHPRLENFSLDLSLPQQEIVAVLKACASPEEAEQLESILRTLTAGSIRIDSFGIVVPLLLTVDESLLAAAAPVKEIPAQAPLAPEEIEAFQKVMEPWDAFLVFVVKNAATDFVDATMREELFDLLINSRYQLLPILTGDVPVEPGDPLRVLFIDAWEELRGIIEHAEERGLVQEQPLRYVTFVNAGDALIALGKAVPGLGMRISSDGLRRWARTLQPAETEDPLRFDWKVDPLLRDLFNFEPEPESLKAVPPLSRNFFDIFFPDAYAAEAELQKQLDRWVPDLDDLLEFQMLMEQLITSTAVEEVERGKLDSRYEAIFQHLLPATALIESCWRQYVRQGGEISFLKSRAGSIGLMQVNQNVWRGFYDLERLRWEVGYNTRAGAQILMRYLKKYGVAAEEKSKDMNNGIRATYAVYNGGPRAALRFMKQKGGRPRNALYDKFWKVYQGIAAGGTVNLSSCSVDLPDA
ncbi:MAG: lytic transglycosylase domain-containing protein [Pseudomonadota bacterium]